MPSITPILSETPGEIQWVGPTLGQHNDVIYKDLLNIDDATIEKLKEEGFI
jgi:crotonobetainyl-CoA:carnitine CoA-transferase CaiB-like acyl-CoA transferase